MQSFVMRSVVCRVVSNRGETRRGQISGGHQSALRGSAELARMSGDPRPSCRRVCGARFGSQHIYAGARHLWHHTATIPTATPEDYRPVTQRVVRSRAQPSGVEMHVLPAAVG